MRLLTACGVAVACCSASAATAAVTHLEAEDYRSGGEGVGYHDKQPENQGGAYRPVEGVDVEVAYDVGGGYNVGWTTHDEWLILTTNPPAWTADPVFPETSNYIVRARVASAIGSWTHRFQLEVGDSVSHLYLGETGGWQSWTTITGEIVSIPAGQHQVKLVFDNGGVNVNWVEFESTDAPLPDFAPPSPEGGRGYMGVREVIDNGPMECEGQTYASLNSGMGVISDYTTAVLNLHDSGSNGHFDDDDSFGLVDAGYRDRGEVDDASLAARGTLRINEAGDYTFGVTSDDGFTLLLPGHDFTSVVGGEIAPFGNGKAIRYWASRGTADTLGVINLPAGDHPFVLTYHEHDGGAALEFYAAEGIRTALDTDFHLVGGRRGLLLVPEPSTLALLAIAAVGLLAYALCKRRR